MTQVINEILGANGLQLRLHVKNDDGKPDVGAIELISHLWNTWAKTVDFPGFQARLLRRKPAALVIFNRKAVNAFHFDLELQTARDAGNETVDPFYGFLYVPPIPLQDVVKVEIPVLRAYLASRFAQPVFERWLEMAMLAKMLAFRFEKFDKFKAAATFEIS